MITAALVTAPILTALVLAWHWRPRHPVAPGTWILLGCYGVLGAGMLWFGLREPAAPEATTWQIWKPTLLYGVLAGVLLGAPLRGWGYPARALVGTYFALSNREWHWINLALGVFCASLGIINIVVAYGGTHDEWNGLRFSWMVNLMGLLLLRMAFVWMDLAVRIGTALWGRARSRRP